MDIAGMTSCLWLGRYWNVCHRKDLGVYYLWQFLISADMLVNKTVSVLL